MQNTSKRGRTRVYALDHERAEHLPGIRIGQKYCISHKEGEGLRGIGGWYPGENPSTRSSTFDARRPTLNGGVLSGFTELMGNSIDEVEPAVAGLCFKLQAGATELFEQTSVRGRSPSCYGDVLPEMK